MWIQVLTIAAATLVSEDLTAIGAGLLVHAGQLPLVLAVAACSIGIYAGDLMLWLAGRVFGRRLLELPVLSSGLPAGADRRFARWFEEHTVAAVLGSRFAPGSRLPLYVAAGACRTSFAKFAAATLLAVGIWTPALVWLTAFFGGRFADLAATLLGAGPAATVAAAIGALLVWRSGVRMGGRRARQRLTASVSRIWRWEFWPMWLFYAPVALWTLLLAIRHGGYRTITAANPGMPDGGVVGESKGAILARLPPDCTIPFVRVEPGAPAARLSAVIGAMTSGAWQFPLVLKPDVGQRGSGVRLAQAIEDVEQYLMRMREAAVVQPFHPGPHEAGIFYYRMPGERRGRVLAITDKHFPVVIGDGLSTLEDLVWTHPRYRMQARTFMRRLGVRALRVPAAGERVSLGLAGNHAQGAMFTDGRALWTPALEARVDAIAQRYDGFFIGRFDVRYTDREAFMAGCDLSVVELNGATAECTNIYDPSNSLLAAYRQLFRQWSLVFRIGALNRRAGLPAASGARLAALIRAHLASATPFPISD